MGGLSWMSRAVRSWTQTGGTFLGRGLQNTSEKQVLAVLGPRCWTCLARLPQSPHAPQCQHLFHSLINITQLNSERLV